MNNLLKEFSYFDNTVKTITIYNIINLIMSIVVMLIILVRTINEFDINNVIVVSIFLVINLIILLLNTRIMNGNRIYCLVLFGLFLIQIISFKIGSYSYKLSLNPIPFNIGLYDIGDLSLELNIIPLIITILLLNILFSYNNKIEKYKKIKSFYKDYLKK